MLAVQVTMMSNCAQPVGKLVQRDRFGAEARGELAPALERAVGDGDRLRLLGREVRRRELDHLARADQQQPLVRDRREDALGELHRRGGHRDRRAADVGLRAHVLGHGERALEQPVQHEAQRPGGLRRAHRVLHLAQDLRLAQHHRIEAARDAERVRHRAILRQRVDVRMQRALRQVVEAREPVRDRLGLVAVEVDLGAVAGRQDRRFLHPARADQVAQRVAQRVRRERDPLAHVEGRGRVVEAESDRGPWFRVNPWAAILPHRHGRSSPTLDSRQERCDKTVDSAPADSRTAPDEPSWSR